MKVVGDRFSISEPVLSRVETEYGAPAKSRVESWVGLVNDDAREDELADSVKMKHANDYFNQVEWITDVEHWGVEDYWATPVETLASNGGDCEDFSIGKYFSLINQMVDGEKLRITYVKSLSYNQAHMVLAYYETPSAEPLILDNINKSILPASQRDDLVPVYSFNAESIWLAKARGKKLEAKSQSSLPQWKRVYQQMILDSSPST